MTTLTTTCEVCGATDLYLARGSATHWGRFAQRTGRGKLRRDNLREALTRNRKRVEPAGYRRMRWFLGTVADRIVSRVRDGALIEDELLAPGEMQDEFRRAFLPYLRVCVHAGVEFERAWIKSASGGGLERQEAPKLPDIHVGLGDRLAANVAAHLDARTNIAWVGISKTMREAVAKELMRAIEDGDDLKTRIKRIQAKAAQMGEVQARRIARTEATSSLNAGQQAEREDADIQHKEWISVLDALTRSYGDGDAFDHLIPDGQTVKNSGVFVVGGQKLRFPGDSSLGASAGNIIQCRCSSVAAWPDEDPTGVAPVTLPTPAKPTPSPVPAPTPPPKPPSGITFSGTPTELTVRVWNAIGKGVADERHAMKVGTIIADDIERELSDRIGELRAITNEREKVAKTWKESQAKLMSKDSKRNRRAAEVAGDTLDEVRAREIAAAVDLKNARAAAVKDRVGQVRDLGGKTLDVSGRSDLESRVQLAAENYPTDWLRDVNRPLTVRSRAAKNESSHYNPNTREIVLPSDPEEGTDIHEVMHVMEDFRPAIARLEKAHKDRRAKAAGASLVVIAKAPSGQDIKVYPGVFFYDYMGREYGNDQFHEILSVGWEHGLTSQPGNIWSDRESVEFVLGVLAGG